MFFGKLAEIVKQYLHKGSKVYVEGQLRTRKWQAQDGSDRYTTEVVVGMGGTMQMLDAKPNGNESQPPRNDASASKRPPARSETPPADGAPPFDDEIPF